MTTRPAMAWVYLGLGGYFTVSMVLAFAAGDLNAGVAYLCTVGAYALCVRLHMHYWEDKVSDEEKSAAIIKALSEPSYSHAENIYRLFVDLEQTYGTSAAIDVVYQKVVEGESVDVSD